MTLAGFLFTGILNYRNEICIERYYNSGLSLNPYNIHSCSQSCNGSTASMHIVYSDVFSFTFVKIHNKGMDLTVDPSCRKSYLP